MVGDGTCSTETVVGLVLEQVLGVLINEHKASGASSSEGSAEPEQHNVLGIGFELVSDLLLEILVGDVGDTFVEHVEKNLPSGQ